MKNLRKTIWIDPFQTGLLIRIVVYCLICQVAAWALLGLFEQLNAAATALGLESQFSFSRFNCILLAALFLIPPLTLDAVRFAHRLVGPLYRFRKTMQAIAAGEQVALVRLRKNDLLMEFQDEFNVMLKYLEQHGYVVLKTPQSPADSEASEPVGTTPPPPSLVGSLSV